MQLPACLGGKNGQVGVGSDGGQCTVVIEEDGHGGRLIDVVGEEEAKVVFGDRGKSTRGQVAVRHAVDRLEERLEPEVDVSVFLSPS